MARRRRRYRRRVLGSSRPYCRAWGSCRRPSNLFHTLFAGIRHNRPTRLRSIECDRGLPRMTSRREGSDNHTRTRWEARLHRTCRPARSRHTRGLRRSHRRCCRTPRRPGRTSRAGTRTRGRRRLHRRPPERCIRRSRSHRRIRRTRRRSWRRPASTSWVRTVQSRTGWDLRLRTSVRQGMGRTRLPLHSRRAPFRS